MASRGFLNHWHRNFVLSHHTLFFNCFSCFVNFDRRSKDLNVIKLHFDLSPKCVETRFSVIIKMNRTDYSNSMPSIVGVTLPLREKSDALVSDNSHTMKLLYSTDLYHREDYFERGGERFTFNRSSAYIINYMYTNESIAWFYSCWFNSPNSRCSRKKNESPFSTTTICKFKSGFRSFKERERENELKHRLGAARQCDGEWSFILNGTEDRDNWRKHGSSRNGCFTNENFVPIHLTRCLSSVHSACSGLF